MTTEKTVVKTRNTLRLQMSDLSLYMVQAHDAIFNGTGFTSMTSGEHISFKRATDSYNTRDRDEQFGLTVDKLKIAYNKRQHRIVCPDHQVSITKESQDFLEADAVAVFDVAVRAN